MSILGIGIYTAFLLSSSTYINRTLYYTFTLQTSFFTRKQKLGIYVYILYKCIAFQFSSIRINLITSVFGCYLVAGKTFFAQISPKRAVFTTFFRRIYAYERIVQKKKQ